MRRSRTSRNGLGMPGVLPARYASSAPTISVDMLFMLPLPGSRQPYPRVDHCVENVDDEVGDHDEERGEEGHAHDRRQVQQRNRLHGELPEAAEAEHPLG